MLHVLGLIIKTFSIVNEVEKKLEKLEYFSGKNSTITGMHKNLVQIAKKKLKILISFLIRPYILQ